MQIDAVAPSVLAALPAGEKGTRTTVRLMREFTRTYKKDMRIRAVAVDLVADLQPKDWASEIRAIFEFVRDRIRYVRDVRGVETLQTPPATLDIGSGDCDDKSTLLASLLEAIGHPTRFVAVGYQSPAKFSHVYVETLAGNRWIALDATMRGPAGWSPRASVARMVVHN